MRPPAITAHSLADVRAALVAATETGAPLTLVSAPGAGGYAGAGWFGEVVRLAVAEYPAARLVAVLDCADAPGFVLAALRQGIKAVRFTGPPETARRLADIAAAHQAELLTGDFPALDLRGTRDPVASCRAWLTQRVG